MDHDGNDSNGNENHTHRSVASVHAQFYFHQREETQMFQHTSEELPDDNEGICKFWIFICWTICFISGRHTIWFVDDNSWHGRFVFFSSSFICTLMWKLIIFNLMVNTLIMWDIERGISWSLFLSICQMSLSNLLILTLSLN